MKEAYWIMGHNEKEQYLLWEFQRKKVYLK